MQYDNTNTAVLFKNERKEKESQPDYTGRVNMNGKEMRLAAWIKESQKGKFFSMKLSELQDSNQNSNQNNNQSFVSDDIPF